MTENDEGKEPPPKTDITKIRNDKQYAEPEDWDMPPFQEDIENQVDEESPEILEDVEPEEAIGTIFTNISKFDIVSIVLGIFVMIIYYVAPSVYAPINTQPSWQIAHMILGFLAGLLIVFGASELILLGVKGISDKLNWNPYLGGIISAVGAALNELVVVIILLFKSRAGGEAEILALTAITLVLTTVLINTLFLGISMLYVSRDEPFHLPKELTFFEANLVLGMMVFSFVIMLFGFVEEFVNIELQLNGQELLASTYSRPFEIVIGIALVLVYFMFIFVLFRNLGRKTSTPQTLITEFLPIDSDGIVLIDPSVERKVVQSRIIPKDTTSIISPLKSTITLVKKPPPEASEKDAEEKGESRINGSRKNDLIKKRQQRNDALATLRRFPWIIVIIIFILGVAGIIQGGNILAASIENGIELFEDIPVLVYSVIVGLVSSSPELVVTFRGLVSGEKETIEVGLVHQVSAINQTFFILFGVPFVLSGIFAIGIPVALEITIVFGGIFVLSTAVILMIMDDNKFDFLEGAVITVMSIVSLLALALIGTSTGI